MEQFTLQNCLGTWMMSAMDVQQTDLLMHINCVISFVIVHYRCSADGLADAHSHC